MDEWEAKLSAVKKARLEERAAERRRVRQKEYDIKKVGHRTLMKKSQ